MTETTIIIQTQVGNLILELKRIGKSEYVVRERYPVIEGGEHTNYVDIVLPTLNFEEAKLRFNTILLAITPATL